jgi:hypothetical protein
MLCTQEVSGSNLILEAKLRIVMVSLDFSRQMME